MKVINLVGVFPPQEKRYLGEDFGPANLTIAKIRGRNSKKGSPKADRARRGRCWAFMLIGVCAWVQGVHSGINRTPPFAEEKSF